MTCASRRPHPGPRPFLHPIPRLSPPAGFAYLAWIIIGTVTALARPVPKLDSFSQSWFKRGTTNEITVNGEALATVGDVFLSGAGVVGAVVPKGQSPVALEGASGGLSTGTIEPGKSVVVRLSIAADAPLGNHELRLASPTGVSNSRTFQISDLDELNEKTPDGKLSEAQLYPLPSAISGAISAPAESDYLRFPLRKGERVIFDLQANRTGSPLDATIYLLDNTGKELAKSEDAHGLDPFIEFTPESDGDYLLRIVDTRFQGGGDYRYRLVAGVRPYLDFLFPFGGRRGSSTEIQFKGINLDGSDKLKLDIATDAPLGRQEIRAHTAAGFSNPLTFEVDDLPEVFETEPNNSKDQANSVQAPVVLNGRIGTPADIDTFRLKSTVDQRLIAEVQARAFGSPLDAFLTLSDANGAVIDRNDDANGPDARIEFDAKKDAEYLLSLRDLTDRGGDRFGYRLVVRPSDTRPDFGVRASGGRFRINRGGTTMIRCDVDRRNGFDGIVRIAPDGLPEGVTGSFLSIGASPNYGWLLITASMDAKVGHFPLRFLATGENLGKALVHSVQFSEVGWLTILPPSSFSIDVGTPSALVDQNGQASIDLGIVRRLGFTGDIQIKTEGIGGIDIPEFTIPNGQSRGVLRLNASYNAAIGVHPLVVGAEAVVDGELQTQYAPLQVPVTTQGIAMFLTAMLPGSSFFRTDAVKLSAVALPTNSTSAANSTEFVVKVDRRGMTNAIELSIDGLPKGVIATVNPIAANAKEASIKLLVTDQAETGKELNFTVTGVTTYNDRVWRQKTQSVSLMVAAPEKEAAQPATQAAANTATPPGITK